MPCGIGGPVQQVYVVRASCRMQWDGALSRRRAGHRASDACWSDGTLRARLDLHGEGDKVVCRRFGGESNPCTSDSGHNVTRTDPFAAGGWQPPPDIISERVHTLATARTFFCATLCALRTSHACEHTRMAQDRTKRCLQCVRRASPSRPLDFHVSPVFPPVS